MQEIISLYRSKYAFKEFYDRLLYNIKNWPKFHIEEKEFLSGFEPSLEIEPVETRIKTSPGDIRVDLPIWFGSKDSDERIVIMGMEPRDTNKVGFLNIERVNRFVFATPFALERPGGKYHSAFGTLLNRQNCFVYLTDVVKEYEVGVDKKEDDKHARNIFREKAMAGRNFLLEELGIIKPTRIVALGNQAHILLTEVLGKGFSVQKVRHPSQGGSKTAREQLATLTQAAINSPQ